MCFRLAVLKDFNTKKGNQKKDKRECFPFVGKIPANFPKPVEKVV